MHHVKKIDNINKLKKWSIFIDIVLANWKMSWTKIHPKVLKKLFRQFMHTGMLIRYEIKVYLGCLRIGQIDCKTF